MTGPADQAASSNQSSGPAQTSDSQCPSQDSASSSQGLATDASASSSNSSSQPDAPVCANCNKSPINSESEALKPCMMCHSVSYCSRECKKAHTKQHKKVCAAAAQEYAKTADVKPAVRAAPKQTSRSGGYQKWQFDT